MCTSGIAVSTVLAAASDSGSQASRCATERSRCASGAKSLASSR